MEAYIEDDLLWKRTAKTERSQNFNVFLYAPNYLSMRYFSLLLVIGSVKKCIKNENFRKELMPFTRFLIVIYF